MRTRSRAQVAAVRLAGQRPRQIGTSTTLPQGTSTFTVPGFDLKSYYTLRPTFYQEPVSTGGVGKTSSQIANDRAIKALEDEILARRLSP